MGIPIPDEMIFILKWKPDFFRERHMFVMMNKISEHQVQLNRYSMDGDEETTIVDQDLYNVRDMTLDLPSKRVYWVDYFTQFIEFCNYDGSKRTRVHGSRLVSFNSLAPGGFENIFQNVFFKLISWIDTLSNSCETALRSMPQNPSDDKSTLVQVMAWCRQAASHYLSQCCPRSLSPYGVTRPQWVNAHLASMFYEIQGWF